MGKLAPFNDNPVNLNCCNGIPELLPQNKSLRFRDGFLRG